MANGTKTSQLLDVCIMPNKISIRDELCEKYALIEASQKRWLENANHLEYNKHELLIY